MAEMITHPINQGEVVYGERLFPGDRVQLNDVYDSTSGRWSETPCPGLLIEEGCTTVWVRPILSEIQKGSDQP